MRLSRVNQLKFFSTGNVLKVFMGKYEKGWASLVDQIVKNLPAVQKTWVWSLGLEDTLEKEMATHSSTLACKIPWTEKPGRLQSMGLQRVGHDWAISLSFFLSAVSQKSDTWTSAPPPPSFSSCPLFSLLVSHCRVVGPDKFGTQGDEIQPTEMHQTNQGSVG